MLNNVFLKSLREQRSSLIWWAVGVIALCLFTVSFYPSLSKSPGITQYLDQAPEWVKSLVGSVDYALPVGYLEGELFSLMAPILFLIFAISRGSGAIAGEEQAGTLDLLLANPLSRRRILLEKAASMAVATLALGVAFWIGLALGALMVGMDINYLHLADATFSCALLGLLFGAVALAAGSASGKRGLTIGVAAALGVAAFFLNSLVPLVKGLEGLSKLSPFYYYLNSKPLENGLNWLHVTVLIAATIFFIGLSVFIFDRRDIRV
jgi:beta-exotoxin I transport system permease protein